MRKSQVTKVIRLKYSKNTLIPSPTLKGSKVYSNGTGNESATQSGSNILHLIFFYKP